MKKRLTFFMVLMQFIFVSFAQKEANVWYFGSYAGLDFNTGQPSVLNGMFISFRNSTACISDSTGKFLFVTENKLIWNRNKVPMQNGIGLLYSGGVTQGCINIQKPGSSNLYYVFTIPNFYWHDPGVYYSVVDMNLDNGLGAVTEEKEILITAAWDVYGGLTAVRHANGHDIWLITRKQKDIDAYAAFLITSEGINPVPVISSANERIDDGTRMECRLHISYDKNYIFETSTGTGYFSPYIDICNFNDITGEIVNIYSLKINSDPPNPTGQQINSIEFSPDSKLAYIVTRTNETEGGDGTEHRTYQFDMSLVEDSAQFVNSGILISHNGGSGIQLATDGKLYLGINEYTTENTESPVSVIHKPWLRGSACNFEESAITFPEGHGAVFYFPNILLDYLYRFEWEGHCSSEPFVFQSNFQPEPASIEWNFGDLLSGGNNISHEINPVHKFTGGGEYEVHTHVEYPNGRIEETSRVVTVTGTPKPRLGPDKLKCEGDEVTLNAGNEQGFYSWSNGVIGENHNEITVSDTGWYWVQVNNNGCLGYDTIHVGLFTKPVLNESNLQLVPTACGGSTGKILGLTVSGEEPLSFEWFDADSNFIANTLDLQNLPVGNYYLHILDGHGCTTVSEAYTIEDAGDISISLIEKQDEHCGQNSGSINITAASGSGGELLFSVDNGASWQAGNGLFEDLPAGNYFIRVKDAFGCESVFENNPLVIENIPGQEVSSVTTVAEIDFLQNGQITIFATANSGELYYSIDNGISFQTNNGHFSNLSAGTYFCEVKDDFGCDTLFTVALTRSITQLIDAIAGNGNTCIGDAAVVPLKVNNFKDIYKFYVKLTYDTTMLNCDGYINVNPKLEANLQASIIPGTDEVIVSWQGDAPTTLEENALMLELVFGAKKQGISGIDWAALPGESAFYNEQLDLINTDYHFGSLRVYTRPSIFLESQKKLCEGDSYLAFPFISGGSGEYTFEWAGPENFYSTNEIIGFSNITQQNAGIYTLTVTDTIDCVESKSVDVIVSENPIIAFAGQDTIFAQSGFILEAGSGYESYLWNTAETTESITIYDEGLYSVIVSTNQSCESSDSVRVLFEVDLKTAFYLPNAFSPDGDGLNDEFKPVEKYDFVKTYQISIFNRWGQLIFETQNISQGWDGTYQGNPVEKGSYVYKIVFTAYPDYTKQQVATGNVVVVR
jgi:gliding motility-associated-like protein